MCNREDPRGAEWREDYVVSEQMNSAPNNRERFTGAVTLHAFMIKDRLTRETIWTAIVHHDGHTIINMFIRSLNRFTIPPESSKGNSFDSLVFIRTAFRRMKPQTGKYLLLTPVSRISSESAAWLLGEVWFRGGYRCSSLCVIPWRIFVCMMRVERERERERERTATFRHVYNSGEWTSTLCV